MYIDVYLYMCMYLYIDTHTYTYMTYISYILAELFDNITHVELLPSKTDLYPTCCLCQ